MRLKLQRELLESFYAEALPLMEKHHAEVDEFPDVPLEVDFDHYLKLQKSNSLRIYSARLDRGPADTLPLIGYVIFRLSKSPHNGMLQACADSVYLDPEQRKGYAGVQLLRFAEQQLKAEAVEVIYHFSKTAHPKLGQLLEKHFGYVEIERVLVRRFS